jgi:hypothetical protein
MPPWNTRTPVTRWLTRAIALLNYGQMEPLGTWFAMPRPEKQLLHFDERWENRTWRFCNPKRQAG